jgi:hypothetical protein
LKIHLVVLILEQIGTLHIIPKGILFAVLIIISKNILSLSGFIFLHPGGIEYL